MATETKKFSIEEVSQHKTRDDCYIIIRDKVYNVSKFLDEHPGGDDVITDLAGEDATEPFDDIGHSGEASDMLTPMLVGEIVTKPPTASQPADPGSTTSLCNSSNWIIASVAVVVMSVIGFYIYQNTRSQYQA